MPVNNLYGGTIPLLTKALDLRLQKQGLIQSNIANLETPGYTMQDFPFAKALESAQAGQGEMARTHPRHLAIDPAEQATNLTLPDAKRPVDLDEEMLKLSQNQLFYQITSQILTKKFEGLRYAIEEGGK